MYSLGYLKNLGTRNMIRNLWFSDIWPHFSLSLTKTCPTLMIRKKLIPTSPEPIFILFDNCYAKEYDGISVVIDKCWQKSISAFEISLEGTFIQIIH